MFVRSFDKSKIKKILLISLTNIGDVILTFPVMDILKQDFPEARLSVVIGPKAETLLKGNPHLDKIFIFNKHQSTFKMISWVWQLRQQHFDLVIDLRNTAIPLLLGARHKTPLLVKKDKTQHMREKHLQRLKMIYDDTQDRHCEAQRGKAISVFISDKDQQYVEKLMKDEIGKDQEFVVVAPGAADQAKRWTEEGFVEIADRIIKEGMGVVFVGDQKDQDIARRIVQKMQGKAVNLCGQTTLIQSAELIQQAQWMMTNDSAPMHLASYLNIPTLALFGPTSPQNYGPWSAKSAFIQGENGSMQSIKSEEVIRVLQKEGYV